MVMIMRGSGSGFGSEESGTSETYIHEWIEAVVSATVRKMIPEMFGSIKTELISIFDEWYVVVASIAAATATSIIDVTALLREKEMPYMEFNNTKPPEFEGVMDPIVAMRWISNVEGCFYTCTCLANLKFWYTENLLRHGAKD